MISITTLLQINLLTRLILSHHAKYNMILFHYLHELIISKNVCYNHGYENEIRNPAKKRSRFTLIHS